MMMSHMMMCQENMNDTCHHETCELYVQNAQNECHVSPCVKNTRWHKTRQHSTLIYEVILWNFRTPELRNFEVKMFDLRESKHEVPKWNLK
jgi:hypothetical protein